MCDLKPIKAAQRTEQERDRERYNTQIHISINGQKYLPCVFAVRIMEFLLEKEKKVRFIDVANFVREAD